MHSLDWNVIITSVSTVNARNGETNERDYIDEDGKEVIPSKSGKN